MRFNSSQPFAKAGSKEREREKYLYALCNYFFLFNVHKNQNKNILNKLSRTLFYDNFLDIFI